MHRCTSDRLQHSQDNLLLIWDWMRHGRYLAIQPRHRWGLALLLLLLLLLHALVLCTAASFRDLARNQGAISIKADDDCLRLHECYRKEYGTQWTADLDARLQELCTDATLTTASGHRVLNVARVEQEIANLASNLFFESLSASLSSSTVSAASSGGSTGESDPVSSVTRAQAKAQMQSGACLGLKAKASSTRVASGSQFKLKFTIINPATSRTAAAYTYILRVDMPSGVKYAAAKTFPAIKNMRFQPVVGGGMVLWELTPIPGFMAKIGVTLEFIVDGCRDSPTPLRFTASGVQVVNGVPLCPAQPAIPEIAVYQDAKKPANKCASGSSSVASIAAVRVPAFTTFGSEGTRCIGSGTPSNLPSPTLDDCFMYCSLRLPVEPSYMNYLDGGNGQPQCSCLGGTCTLALIASGGATSRKRSRVLKRTMVSRREEGRLTEEVDTNLHLHGGRRELDEARFGAYQITSLATREPTASPTQGPTMSPTANCLIPATFLANFEYCEPKLCPDYLWRIKHLNTSGSDLADPTAYDVCRSACSYLTLGEPGNTETQGMRARCQTRCEDGGYGSFACQAYCTDYPGDPACPRPGCTTLASIEANLEYCSQNVCDALFPVVNPPLAGQNATTYAVCTQACSAQRLGPEGTADTADQRERCRNLCVVDGIENSLACLSYCLSFPSDMTVCPPPATVAAIAQKKTFTPSPTAAPTAAPTVHCLAPMIFEKNMGFCDATMCSPFMWKVSELSSSSSSADIEGTAADICASMCNKLSLGRLQFDSNNTVVATPPLRAKCRARCTLDGQRGSFLCQSYCHDYPLDPVCSLPDCTTLASVEANLEICDHHYCAALYAPKDYSTLAMGSLEEESDLCGLPCSAQRLGRLDDLNTYDATLPMRGRCQARCRVAGVEKSVMCLSYCLSFPADPVCPDPATVALVANTTLHSPDCYIPDVFAQNMAVCEERLCASLNWVEDLASSNTTSDPTAYDVCTGTCSKEALGLLSAQDPSVNATLEKQRGRCQDRCRQDGLESFLCRRYCENFPSDPVCPKPECMTFASIEANPEYCDRSACLRFLPWDPFRPVSADELLQESVCTQACSAQRLGPAGGVDTSVMRGHCQRLCTLSGPERSRLCLSYCLSFPNDPVCPEPGVVEDLMARGKPPTPSPSPPVFQQPLQPLLFSAANMSTALSTSPTTWPAVPVLSIKQLALGYNPFLGLEPHEQLGVYTRNEIFQFHLDPENVFLVQAPNPNLQANTVARFLAPLEYYVTPALADCSYMNQEANTLSKSRSEYMATSSRSKSMGAEAQPGGKLSRAGGSTVDTTTDEISKTIPGLGGEISPQISVSASVGNSRESQTGRNYEAQGQTKSITTRLKRAYYKAGLRVDRFHKESFTPSFRSDARELGHRPYSFTATIEFITKYGAYIFDGATMGASLYRSYFFSEDTGDSDISKLTKMDSFANVNALVTSKSTRGTSQTEDLEGGNTITYSYTDIERIGEFNTGSSSADSIGETNSCAIGATISPQMIEYALKPLWDPDIPLELFMPKTEANNFREYLRNATITQLAGGASCKDEFVGDCYGTGGICLPKYDPESGVYDFECANPEREGRKGLFEYDVYVFGLEVKDYGDRTSNFPTWWGHHTPSYAPPQIRRQNGIFGYNQATIEVSGEDDTTPRVYCPMSNYTNFWTGFNYADPLNHPGNPICNSNIDGTFTVRPSSSTRSHVTIKLSSMKTRGCAYQKNEAQCERLFTVLANKEGEDSLSCKHDVAGVRYYAQPSMGVAVCPVTIAYNGTRETAETCYYIYKWIGSWHRDDKRFTKNPGHPSTDIGYVRQLDNILPTYTEMYMVTLDPELDMEFVSLTFELDRYSSKPVNIGTTPPPDGRVGIRNSLLPEQVGTENLIRFSDLKKKLNQGFEMSL